ncbi:MAG: beta-galactosidase [Ruminococcaceae bacterium]|nr:beta-galactosidase [Oscillospiraceae bacterium]
MIPRNEHPNPQFKRRDYEILNGVWGFEIDNSGSGEQRGLVDKKTFDSEIIVPFCPESKLSGINNTDFMNAVWYKREIDIPAEKLSGRTILHFGAVDYTSTIYINSKKVMTHSGGFASFEADITDYVVAGKNTLVVHVQDPIRYKKLPSGKQSKNYASRGCHYTRTTGIWQTVWLEYKPIQHIKGFKYYTDTENGTVTVVTDVHGNGDLATEITYNNKLMAKSSVKASGTITQTFTLCEKHLWEPGHGRLYDVKFTFGNDEVTSYFGLRSIGLDGMKFLLNGKPFFQRTVLDQGYYPDSIMTAPSEQALIDDIEMSMALGFNGARLHQKVFEPLFLYHCDRLGYTVWGEYASWGLSYHADGFMQVIPEWIEVLERDFNHPSIIGWCPLNEVWEDFEDEFIKQICVATKRFDPTRPCIDVSGGFHTDATDIYCLHDYEQNPEILGEKYAFFEAGTHPQNNWTRDGDYHSQPIYVSEYGGIAWKTGDVQGWGYGSAPKTKKEYLERYTALTKILLNNKNIMGFCYTQLYDIEQEINGIYTYGRKPKFTKEEMEMIKAANTAPAAMEEQ